tara:strand:+ start:753 stop:1082 length:330 start_codon:yes stop_codon:yes gene_type:complete
MEELDGKEVYVVGWVGDCWSRNCNLYNTRSEANLSLQNDVHERLDNRELNITITGWTPVSYFQGKRVLVTGRVNATCWRGRIPDENGNQFFCMDARDDIEDPSVRHLIS